MKKSLISSKEKWQHHLHLDSLTDADNKRQVLSFVAMLVIAILFLIVLIYSNYNTYHPLLLLTLISALVGLSVALIIYFKTKELAAITLILSSVIVMLTILLIYTGGKDKTALYWLMFSPLAAYAILGVRKGSILTFGLVICILTLLYGPDIGQTVYGSTEKSRFFASYCIVILFAFINEYYRNQSFETISSISLEQKQKANTDPLTGLANRRFLDAQLLPQIQHNSENFEPLSVIIADIDNFKQINDTFGHDIGDSGIIHVAKRFKNQVRSSDVVIRYGGEEFLIFLPKASLVQAIEIANNMRLDLEENALITNQQSMPLTCSFGVAEVTDINEFDQAIKNADLHLYKAKKTGKNKVEG
ncbi:GGDEF domain-containing protein [Thalassotalea piscium]